MADHAPCTGIIKNGHVSVRGHFMWRDRYVVVEPGLVTVLRSSKGAIKAKIDLLAPNVRIIFHEDHTQLMISSHGCDTLFQCHSTSERDAWVSAMYTAKGNHGGDTDCENSDLVMSSMEEFDNEGDKRPTSDPFAATSVVDGRSDPDRESDSDDDAAYSDTLQAFQDLRSSIMECHLSLMDDADTDSDAPRAETPHVAPAIRRDEEAIKKRHLSAIVLFIQTVRHGGRAVLLHLDVLRAVAGMSLEDILLAIGEKQRDKAQQQQQSSSSAIGLQRLHVATFVRYILFHPLYTKHHEAAAHHTPQVDALIDRYFPHCRLRRFSHDLEQGTSMSVHALELDVSRWQRKDSRSTSTSGHQPDYVPGPRPAVQGLVNTARVAPASMTKADAMLKKKRHSFPNILLPLQIGPLATTTTSLARLDSARVPLQLQGKRSSSDQMNTSTPGDAAAAGDSDLFQDELLPDPLRTVLWKFSCQEVAEQLSIFHQQQLASMKLWEIVHTPQQSAKRTTDHFNRLVVFFVWSVLVEDSAKDRAEAIESIISIASVASAAPLHNFHLVMACVGCLGDTPLMPSRLPLTWKKVRSKYKAQLVQLRAICDHTGGFETLRKKQASESIKGSCIPFVGVIGVTLERLRLIPYLIETAASVEKINLDKLDRQYVAVSVLENAMLRPYKLQEIDSLQDWIRNKMISIDGFASPRLLQLRSQQLLAMETQQQSGSRHSSLYRSRGSPGTGGSSADQRSDPGPPMLAFRDICSILVSAKDPSERIQICVEAMLADDRQPSAIRLRKFKQDFKQSACHSACHVVVANVRNCVDAMKQEMLLFKNVEIMQLTGLDENSIQLERELYMAVVDAVTRPISMWLFTKVKHAFASEDARVLRCIHEYQKHESHNKHRPEGSPVAVASVTKSAAPMDMLHALCDALRWIPTEADRENRIHCCLDMLSTPSVCNYPFSVVFLLQQSLDTVFLSRELRETLELVDAAVSFASSRLLKCASRSSMSIVWASGNVSGSGSCKSLSLQPPEVVPVVAITSAH